MQRAEKQKDRFSALLQNKKNILRIYKKILQKKCICVQKYFLCYNEKKKGNIASGHQSERLDESCSNEVKGGCYYEEDE